MIGRELLHSGSFWSFLLSIDKDLAECARQKATPSHGYTPPRSGSKICAIEVPKTSASLKARGKLGSYLSFSIAFTV